MKRRGVVLLITVGFITVIMAVIGYQFTLVDRGLKRASQESFYYQSALLLHDVQKKLLPGVLDQILAECGDISRAECLEGFLSMSYDIPTPLINDPTVGTVVITLKPPATGFDPNRFKTLTTPEQREFFQVFTETQQLIDSQLLMDLIDLALETNATRDSYSFLQYDEDIPLNDIFFRKGEIVDREQFDVILDAYYARTLDKKVYHLDWDAFLDFRTGESPPVFALLKSEYCKSLFPDQPVEWIRTYCDNEEDIFYTEEDTGFSQADINRTRDDFGISFVPDTSQVLVEVLFTREEHSARFRFMYDLGSKKALWTETAM